MISGYTKFFALLGFISLVARAEGEIAGAIVGAAQAAGTAAAAAIQAGADVEVAKINAGSSVTQTQIQADTSKYLADTQSQVAMQQAITSKEIVESNNYYQTLNLEKTLMFKMWQDSMDTQLKREEMYYDYTQKLAEISQKRETEQAKLELEKTKMKMALTQAGLAPGFSVGKSELSISSPNSAISTAAATRTFSPTLASSGNGMGATTLANTATAMTASNRALTRGVASIGNSRSPIHNFFGGSLAAGSSRNAKKRTDLDTFQEQGNAIASNSAHVHGSGRAHRYAKDTGFENSGRQISDDGHAAIARTSGHRRSVNGGSGEAVD